MPRRVAVIHHGFIPTYRVRLYELLQQQGDIQYVVFFGQPPSGSGHRAARGPFEFPSVEVRNRELMLGRKSAIYQPILRPVLSQGFDAAVLGTPVNLLANTPLLLALKALRRPVFLWGQGREKAELTHPALRLASRVASRAKEGLARLADGYLVYTEAGRAALVRQGVDPANLVVLRNTLDLEGEVALHEGLSAVDTGGLRAELGLRADSVVLVYLGRVYAEKRVPELCALVRAIRDRELTALPVEAVIIGDGPDMPAVRDAAEGLGCVHLVGELHDRPKIAEYLRVASAVVMPGKAGLTVNHAFAHGLPVLTRESDLHASEVEYIEPGVNGLIVPGDPDAFLTAVAGFVESEAERAHLAAGARRSRDALTLEAMASAFNAAVERVLAGRPPAEDGAQPQALGRLSADRPSDAEHANGNDPRDVRNRRTTQV